MQTVEASRRSNSRLRTLVSSPDFVVSAISYALIAAMCLHWMRPGSVIETGDDYWQYRPLHAMLRGIAAWSHLNAVDGARNVGFYAVPWALPTALLTVAGGESFAQVAMLALMRGFEWAGAYALCRRLGAGRTASFTAAWVLLLNPYVHTLTINAPVFDWSLACFVWIGWAYVAAAGDPRKRDVGVLALGAITAIPLAFLAQNPGLILVAAMAVVLFFGLGLVIARDRAAYARWSALGALAMLATSLWWVVPTANYVFGSTVTAETNVRGYDWVVANSSLLNNLRFIPTWAWSYATYFPYAKAFDSNPVSYAAGFSIALLVGLGLALARGRKSTVARYCAIVGLVMLFVSKGEHGPLQELNTLLYRLPGLVVFREPTSKTPLIALLFFIPIVAFAIDAVGRRVALGLRVSSTTAVAIFAGTTLVASGVSAYPLLTGEVFHGATPGLPSVYVALPSYWRAAGAFLNDRKDRGALLVLPSDTFYQASYSWGYYGYDGLAFLMFDRHVENEILGTYTQTPAVNAITDRIVEAIRRRSPLSRSMLADFGVRYLLYRNDLRGDEPASPSEAAVLAIPGATLVRRFGPLDIVDVGDPGPDVAETADWIATDGTPEADATLEIRALLERLPRIDGSAPATKRLPPPLVFERAIASPQRAETGSENALVPVRFVATNYADAAQLMRGRRNAPATMSFLRAAVEPVATRMSAPELAPPRPDGAIPLLRPQAIAQIGQVALFNQTGAPLRFDVDATVQSTRDAVYSLSSGTGRWRSMPVRADVKPTFAHFVSVTAVPGENTYSLATDAGDPVPIGALHFGAVRTIRSRAASPVYENVGSIALNAPVADVMSVKITRRRTTSARTFAAIAIFSYGGRKYSCHSEFAPNGEDTTIVADIAACLQDGVVSRQLSLDDLWQSILQRVEIEASIPPNDGSASAKDDVSSVEVESNRAASSQDGVVPRGGNEPPWLDPRLSLLTIGIPRRPYGPPVEENVRFAVDGITVANRESESATPAILATREVYDAEWSAVCLGRCPVFPPHLRVDGYRNGWIVSGTGTIVLFQQIVLLQGLLAVLSLATLGWLGMRMRRLRAT